MSVRINDKADARFMIDTGANITILSTAMARRLGLTVKQKPAEKDNDSADSNGPVPYVTVENLNVGGLRFNGDLYVIDIINPTTNDPESSYDGRLGTNILGHFAVGFDPERNKAFFIPNGKLNKEQLSYLGMVDTPGYAIEAESMDAQNDSERLKVVANVGNVTGFPVLLYTGSPMSMVLDTQKKLKPPAGIEGAHSVYAVWGVSWDYTMYPFPALSLGSATAAATKNAVTPFECGIVTDDAHVVSGILGMDYLSRFRTVIDFPAKKVYLRPVSNPKHLRYPTEASRQSAVRTIGDMSIMPSDAGIWAVTAVEKEGPFGKAGAQAGDILSIINGQSPDGKTASEILTLLHKHAEYADLQVLRDGKTVQMRADRK